MEILKQMHQAKCAPFNVNEIRTRKSGAKEICSGDLTATDAPEKKL
jgi:hypothetical protein